MDLYAVFGRSNGMDARYAVNGGGNRKSRCQNGALNLNNWYGVEHGGDRKSNDRNCHLKNDDTPKNQSELANIYGIARTTMNNYMRLAKAIPELEDLVDTGILAPTTALAIISQIPTNILTMYIKSNNIDI